MPRMLVVIFLVWTGAMLAVVSASAQSKTKNSSGGQKKAAASKSGSSRDIGQNSNEGFDLLRVAKVQRDLQLNEQQKVQILRLSMEMRKARFNMKKKLGEILDAQQLQRLKQIRLQVEGPAGINSHEVAMALGLTREQRMDLKALQGKIREDITIIFQEVRGLTVDERRAKIPEIVRKIQEIRVTTTQKALDLLTPKQREEFDAMQGKKLNLAPPMP